MSQYCSIIVGSGHYLPDRVVSNEELSKYVDTSDEWIVSRTGIRNRHFAADGELTSDLAHKAAELALKDANLKPQDIDLLVLATATPDHTFPATATRVQAKLGMTKGMAFDVSAVCGGFLLALETADNSIRLGRAKHALVIGAETFSRLLDMKDRSTCVLFGDGAGAVVLKAEEANESDSRGVLGVYLQSDGRHHDLLYADGGPSSTGKSGVVRMQGQEVFRHAVSKLVASANTTLARHNFTIQDIDWFIPHQANIRIIDAIAKRLGLPSEKVVATVADHANTSAASIPMAVSIAARNGSLKRGDLIMHEAIGGGLVWGSALVRW